MPAVTVSDLTILPRIFAQGEIRYRSTKGLTLAPSGYEGEGFPVRRAFAGVELADLDPFIHLDQMGEVEYAPGEPKGTPWHPHRGFETVTYMIDGIFDHRDSHGGGGTITNGDTQWMTAGSGILHIEKPPESLVMSGGLFHGFQLWVNLPKAKKMSAPRYQDLRASEVVLFTNQDGGALMRLIAGEIAGLKGPGSTQTPIVLIHATINAGARIELPWNEKFNSLVYTLNGFGKVGRDQAPIRAGVLAVEHNGNTLVIEADQQQESRSPQLDVLILGGEPISESIAWMGPFVMNTKAEVLQAFEDFRKGLLGAIPSDELEEKRPLNRSGEGHKLSGDVRKVHGNDGEIHEG